MPNRVRAHSSPEATASSGCSSSHKGMVTQHGSDTGLLIALLEVLRAPTELTRDSGAGGGNGSRLLEWDGMGLGAVWRQSCRSLQPTNSCQFCASLMTNAAEC